MSTRDYDEWLFGKLASDPRDAATYLRVHAEDPDIDIGHLRAVAIIVADALERHIYAPTADAATPPIFWFSVLRSECGMSQADLGVAAGIAQSQISRFESGAAKPSESQLKRLAEALHVPPDMVFRMLDDVGTQMPPQP